MAPPPPVFRSIAEALAWRSEEMRAIHERVEAKLDAVLRLQKDETAAIRRGDEWDADDIRGKIAVLLQSIEYATRVR